MNKGRVQQYYAEQMAVTSVEPFYKQHELMYKKLGIPPKKRGG